MANNVKHGKRLYKQMALEVAVRNPERYEAILNTFAKFEGEMLNDDGILNIYAQLYIDGVVTTDKIKEENLTLSYIKNWIVVNNSHNNEWGFPTGYQAAFTRYLKTLSEFGFIYSQYNQKLRLSPLAKALVNDKITLSEAFAIQSVRFWRKSPYRRVLNDFNFFTFIIDAIIERDKKGHRLSYNQFMVGLFSDDGNVEKYLNLLETNKIGADQEAAYDLVYSLYNEVDDKHAKVSKMTSAFRDYGNTVFRVLQLTGFITVDYKGMLLLSPNKKRIPFYQELKNIGKSIPESAKENEEEYFEMLGAFDSSMETLVYAFREKEDHSTAEYNKKIPIIINSYGLDKDGIEQALVKVSSGDKRGKDCFWFIQDPVKFEFLLTLFVYSYYGDKFVYKPNYICDEAGIPYSHAPGNIGDIEIYNREKYWLIEATLIRAKTQQVNNETVNLFRHIDESREGDKYLTLVAPYIHDDTRLIFNVASVLTLMEKDGIKLNSMSQTTDDFVKSVKSSDYFISTKDNSKAFISELKNTLDRVLL
ncbi:MAG: AlwI family type II restriction endonuclease [Bacteroidales bacterium]|nr:AlwI family type II restriction endonuclease [Candidatus Physcocola equi]